MKSKLSAFFRDKNGAIVIWQTPNFPLSAWAFVSVASWALPNQPSLSYLGNVALVVWAYGELRYGASMFRRVLGAAVALASILPHLR